MGNDIILSGNQDIDQYLSGLCNAIQNSEEYLRYREASEEIQAQPELYSRVNELRRNNYALQNRNAGVMSNEEYMGISNFSKSLHENPVVSRFLNAEVELGRLLQHVSKEIFECIDFDTDFL